MSKVYVTGAAGMIGSSVCKRLVQDGHKVVGLDNFWRGREENIDSLKNHPSFEFIFCDLSESTDWGAKLDFDSMIIHIADIVAGIGYVFGNEFEVFSQNCKINSNISRVINKNPPAKVIYLGTACSYPQGLQRNVLSSVLSEDQKFPADPESGYGWSKLIGEIELKLAVKKSNTKLITLDLHNVYGSPCIYSDATSQVIPSLIFRALNLRGEPLSVWGNGQQGRAFIHVDDVVEAVVLGLQYNGDVDNIMIGPDYCTTIKEVAEIIISHPKVTSNEIEYDLTKPMGDLGRFADYSLAKSELNWSPSVSLKSGVYDLIDYIYTDLNK